MNQINTSIVQKLKLIFSPAHRVTIRPIPLHHTQPWTVPKRGHQLTHTFQRELLVSAPISPIVLTLATVRIVTVQSDHLHVWKQSAQMDRTQLVMGALDWCINLQHFDGTQWCDLLGCDGIMTRQQQPKWMNQLKVVTSAVSCPRAALKFTNENVS